MTGSTSSRWTRRACATSWRTSRASPTAARCSSRRRWSSSAARPPSNLSQVLDQASLPILGSTAQSIDIASDRHLFEEFLSRTGIPNPPGAAVTNVEQALNVASEIGYPILVRPSYVLGGRAMEIVQNATELVRYMNAAVAAGGGRRVLIDRYVEGREVEVDAVCDGENVLIPGIMEHVERAGVHSGDSMAIYPGLTLSEEEVDTVVDYTTRIGRALQVRGLMNIQYVVAGGPAYRSPGGESAARDTQVFVIEVNPRASRTIPFISKITDVPMVRLAIGVMLGKSLPEQGYRGGLWKRQRLVAVKAPVFSMSKLAGVDTYLGPEMKSTGEVMGLDHDFQGALSKALIAAGLTLPPGGSVLLSIADRHKAEAVLMFRQLAAAGCTLYATAGTADTIRGIGLDVVTVPKRLTETRPQRRRHHRGRNGRRRHQHRHRRPRRPPGRLLDSPRRSRQAPSPAHLARHRAGRRREPRQRRRQIQHQAAQRLSRRAFVIPLQPNLKNFMCYRTTPRCSISNLSTSHASAGQNGHGKTALLDAITWALWGHARARTQEELVHQGERDMAVDLEFMARDQRHRVTRRHSRSTRGGQGSTILELQVSSGNGFRPISGNTLRETETRINDLLPHGLRHLHQHGLPAAGRRRTGSPPAGPPTARRR